MVLIVFLLPSDCGWEEKVKSVARQTRIVMVTVQCLGVYYNAATALNCKYDGSSF